MSVNNLYRLRDFLTFEDEDDFYYLQIIRRRKDNPELKKTEKVVKNYYIENLEYLDRKWNEIKTLCDTFNARAYLRLNKRNYKDLTYEANHLLAKYMKSNDYRATMSVWDKVCGRNHSAETKLWIIDIDELRTDDQKRDMGKLCFVINQLRPEDSLSKVKAIIPSSSGYHIITTPFDRKQFYELFEKYDLNLDIDIKGDNPTNLYIA